MVILICILVFLFSMNNYVEACDWEESERAKERRHRELMELEECKLKQREARRRRVRTMARDEHGRFIAQEVIEETID